MDVTPPSPWPWIDRPVSGLLPATGRPVKTRFPYASPKRLSLPLRSKSLTHYTKGTQSPTRRQAPTACTHTVSGSISLPSTGFFSPFPHGTGSLSVGREYLALEGGPPIFRQSFTCSALLVAHLVPQATFRVRGYHPVSPDFPDRSTRSLAKECKAVSRSLAATEEISVDFFSSRYLDVSVPWVRLPLQKERDTPKGGFPHSEIPGSKLVCQLPEAYRRLPRPSSPSTAKASTVRACSLDHITPRTLESLGS